VDLRRGCRRRIVETAGNAQVNNVRLSGDIVAKGAADRYTASLIATPANDRTFSLTLGCRF